MSVGEAKSSLQSALDFLLHDERYVTFFEKISHIQSRLDRPVEIEANSQGIIKVLDQAKYYLTKLQQEYVQQSHQIQDRDRFLDTLTGAVLVESTLRQEPTIFAAPLFNTKDTSLKQLLQNEKSPTTSYLELNKVIVDGFSHALTTKTPTELSMTPLQHESKRLFFADLKQKIDNTL
jgi:uncharacterized protein (DUF2344 family)